MGAPFQDRAAAVRGHNAENTADGSRLARAVGTDQSEYAGAVHLKAKIVDSDLAAERFAQILYKQAHFLSSFKAPLWERGIRARRRRAVTDLFYHGMTRL